MRRRRRRRLRRRRGRRSRCRSRPRRRPSHERRYARGLCQRCQQAQALKRLVHAHSDPCCPLVHPPCDTHTHCCNPRLATLGTFWGPPPAPPPARPARLAASAIAKSLTAARQPRAHVRLRRRQQLRDRHLGLLKREQVLDRDRAARPLVAADQQQPPRASALSGLDSGLGASGGPAVGVWGAIAARAPLAPLRPACSSRLAWCKPRDSAPSVEGQNHGLTWVARAPWEAMQGPAAAKAQNTRGAGHGNQTRAAQPTARAQASRAQAK
jgi:hypothetical protein